LLIDFVGRIGDEVFQGGSATDVDVEVAGPGFIPGFTEQLEGMSPGETRVIAVTFPAEYGVPEIAGKEASFEITAKKLRRQVLPPIDDALAQKAGLENLEKLRAVVTEQIQREYDQISRLRLKRRLLDVLADRANFAAPQGMVDAEFAQIWQRVEAERAAGRADEDDAGKDEETLKAEYRAIADRRVRLGLLLSEIGRAHGVTVSNEDLTRAMRAEAARYPGREQAVLEFFRKNPRAADGLRGPIFEEKVVDFVLELAKIEEKQVSGEELGRDEDEPAQGEASAA
jgi:trigger factor